jgi:hypothetical protein
MVVNRRQVAAPGGSLVRIRNVIRTCVVALLLTSCSLGDPVDTPSLNVFVEVDDPQLTVGQESITITVSARNVGYSTLTLTGQTGCLLYVEVFNPQGTVVWNTQSSCSGGTVTEEIAVGENKVQSFTWDGSNLGGGLLPAGLYLLRGAARTSGSTFVGTLTIALD